MKKLSLSTLNFSNGLLSASEKRRITGGRWDECAVECICSWGTGWYGGPSCPFDCDRLNIPPEHCWS